jgi:hypothetical protein
MRGLLLQALIRSKPDLNSCDNANLSRDNAPINKPSENTQKTSKKQLHHLINKKKLRKYYNTGAASTLYQIIN